MKNKLFNIIVRMSLLNAIVFSTTAFASENEPSENREPAGKRALKPYEHVAIQEKRLEQKNQERSEKMRAQQSNHLEKVEVSIDQKRLVESKSDSIKKGLIDKNLYFTTHQGIYHSTLAITSNGEYVEFEDGSCWSVSFWDRNKIFSWLTTDRIIISQNTNLFSSHYYRLINIDTGDKVSVNLKVKPFYNGYYTRWITAIDYLQNVVYLNDGSIWSIDYFDHSIVATWLPNDTIIIGVNAHTCGACPANILINAETLEYACGNCIN